MLLLMLTCPAGLCWGLDRPSRTPSTCVAWQLQHWGQRTIRGQRGVQVRRWVEHREEFTDVEEYSKNYTLKDRYLKHISNKPKFHDLPCNILKLKNGLQIPQSSKMCRQFGAYNQRSIYIKNNKNVKNIKHLLLYTTESFRLYHKRKLLAANTTSLT